MNAEEDVMSSAYENAMSDREANSYTQKYPVDMLTMDDLDYALNVAHQAIDTTNARSGLAQLRAAAAERDEARTLSGVIDGVTLSEWIYEELELSLNARIERDELKAQLQAANERADLMSRMAHANAERARLGDEMLAQCRRTITAQATQLEQAYTVIDKLKIALPDSNALNNGLYAWNELTGGDQEMVKNSRKDADVWISANTPTPQEERIEEREMSEHDKEQAIEAELSFWHGAE